MAAVRATPVLEDAVGAIESQLAQLGRALRDRDVPAIETHSQELQRALAGAVQRFSQAAREPGGVSPTLRHRLALASGQVAAQRESLARATAALDRAIDVLLPPDLPAAAYAAHGAARPLTASRTSA